MADHKEPEKLFDNPVPIDTPGGVYKDSLMPPFVALLANSVYERQANEVIPPFLSNWILKVDPAREKESKSVPSQDLKGWLA